MFNWASYNESLVRRGEIILDFGVIDGWYDELERMNQGKRGAAYGYPDSFVQLLGYVKAYFHLPWIVSKYNLSTIHPETGYSDLYTGKSFRVDPFKHIQISPLSDLWAKSTGSTTNRFQAHYHPLKTAADSLSKVQTSLSTIHPETGYSDIYTGKSFRVDPFKHIQISPLSDLWAKSTGSTTNRFQAHYDPLNQAVHSLG